MKVISFSLWGNNTMYTHGVIENCKLAKSIYPDWIVWVYVDKTVPSDIITQIKIEGGTIIYMDFHNAHCNIPQKYGNNTWINATWRFTPIINNEVELFISRDGDSRLSVREANLVNEWIASDKEFHIIRDHAGHLEPILAGMFGVKRGSFYTLMLEKLDYFYSIYNTTYSKAIDSTLKGIDQEFLSVCIYPNINHNRMTHVSAGMMCPDDIIIPPPSDDNFIGQVYLDKYSKRTVFKYESGIIKV